jgi:hypothetical protein
MADSITKAGTAAGKKFTVMGGNHLTSDDIFIVTSRESEEAS